jgi:mannose-1-phosphate guanylyltransferase
MAWAEARVLDHVQVEAVLLDTGGALSLAANEKELHSEHLLVHNGDILHDLDLRKPWEAHIASKADVTLVVVDRERINTVLSRDTGFVGVAGHARTPESSLTDSVRSTFTGIAFYRTSVLKGLARGAWSVKELWFDLLEQGKNVQVWFAPDDCLWEDCGTPEDLARVTRDELQRRHLSQWIDPSAQVHPESRLSPLSVAEFGTRLYRGAVLEDSIVLPGGEVGPHEILHRVIRNPGGDVKW